MRGVKSGEVEKGTGACQEWPIQEAQVMRPG